MNQVGVFRLDPQYTKNIHEEVFKLYRQADSAFNNWGEVLQVKPEEKWDKKNYAILKVEPEVKRDYKNYPLSKEKQLKLQIDITKYVNDLRKYFYRTNFYTLGNYMNISDMRCNYFLYKTFKKLLIFTNNESKLCNQKR